MPLKIIAFLTALSLCALCQKVNATTQYPDILLYNHDTFSIQNFPLASQKALKIESTFGNDVISTACWRGYRAVWIIKNNQLFLSEIYDCEGKAKADLTSLFGIKVKGGLVKADWFTDSLWCTLKSNDLLYWNTEGIYFEHQTLLFFSNGNITAKNQYKNYDQFSYYSDVNHLYDYIYKHISWRDIPSFKDDTITASFTANQFGRIDSIWIKSNYSPLLEQETRRVLAAIPQWNIHYNRGRFERIPRSVQIIFNEEKRRTYSK